MNNDMKTEVKERYARAARNSSCCSGETSEQSCCCGTPSFSSTPLGCGMPLRHADLRRGETVLDLGCGPGLEAMAVARVVGPEGRIIGVDMTPQMIEAARERAAEQGAGNTEFLLGDIEALPLPEATADVVISNCVINLAPDKAAVFAEMYRVLKPGGRFVVSDVVSEGNLPDSIRNNPELWAGCVAGAIDRDAYLDVIRATGFQQVRVQDEIRYGTIRNDDAEDSFQLLSITVSGFKPEAAAPALDPGN